MSPEDPNNPGLNTKNPDLGSVPLPEPAAVKSPYAPKSGTLGDIADEVASNDSGSGSQPTPIPTAGIVTEEQEASAAPAEAKAQDGAPANAKPKGKKLPLIIGLVVVVLVIVGIVLFLIIAKPSEGGNSGGNGGQKLSGGDSFYSHENFLVRSGQSGIRKSAIYNPNGEQVTDFVYEAAPETFVANAALVKKGSDYGIIDQEGKEIIEFGKYGKIEAYGNLYGLTKDGRMILVNNKGEEVVEYTKENVDKYSEYSDGQTTPYTILRSDNHYTVYSPKGAKLLEFDSILKPTLSSPEFGYEDSSTVVVYSGGIIVLDDKGNEIRRIEKNITERLYATFVSKSHNVIGLSTNSYPVLKSLGSLEIPDDRRDNALIIGDNYYDFDSSLCPGLYYDDSRVEGDEDGIVLCVRDASGNYPITSDGKLAVNEYYFANADSTAASLIKNDYIYPIGLDSYVIKTDSNPSFSIFYKGKKISNLVSGNKKNSTDVNKFTKTETSTEYNVLGMADNYIIQEITKTTTFYFTDSSLKERLKEPTHKESGKIVFMKKNGDKICTFDKAGYSGVSPQKGSDAVTRLTSTHVSGFINGHALVSQVSSREDPNFTLFKLINDKCELVDEDYYYAQIKGIGSLTAITRKGKASSFTSSILDKDGKTVIESKKATKDPMPISVAHYIEDVYVANDDGKHILIGFDKALGEIKQQCMGAGVYLDAHYLEFYNGTCLDNSGPIEHQYFLPNGKQFYQWKETN